MHVERSFECQTFGMLPSKYGVWRFGEELFEDRFGLVEDNIVDVLATHPPANSRHPHDEGLLHIGMGWRCISSACFLLFRWVQARWNVTPVSMTQSRKSRSFTDRPRAFTTNASRLVEWCQEKATPNCCHGPAWAAHTGAIVGHSWVICAMVSLVSKLCGQSRCSGSSGL